MAFNFFTAFFYLFLFMCGSSCGQLGAGSAIEQVSNAGSTIDLFTKETISAAKGPDGGQAKPETINVKDFYSPVLLLANNYIVALAGVNRTDEYKKNIDILTKYIENEKLSTNVVKAGEWNTQFATLNEDDKNEDTYIVKGLLAAVNNNKIYFLLVNYSKETESDPSDIFKLTLRVSVGTLPPAGGAKNFIDWKQYALTANKISNEFKRKFEQEHQTDIFFCGSTFLTKENNTVFALVIGDTNKKQFALMQLKDENIEKECVYTDIAKDCDPYFFPWGDKIIMVPVSCVEKSEKQIMELTDVGQQWEKNTGSFSRQYGFLKDKKHFTTIKIENKPVLLFTEKKKTEVNLWMSDGNRSTKIEAITTIDSKKTFYGSILHTENGLFVLYQKYEVEATGQNIINNIFFTKVKKPLDEITKTFNAWKKNDNDIQTHCKETSIAYIPCSTDGLVGYLFDTDEQNNHWIDKYFYKNALVTAKEVENVTGGFTFSGVGVGAKWEVGKDDEDQPYNLADPGFTLVATVKIDAIPKEGEFNSVLGVRLKTAKNEQTTDSIGLLCTEKGVWAVNKEKTTNVIESNEECGQGNTYSVILVLEEDTKLKIYVNGKEITFLGNEEIKLEKKKYYYPLLLWRY